MAVVGSCQRAASQDLDAAIARRLHAGARQVPVPRDHHLVDQAGVEEGAGDVGPAFDQQPRDAVLVQPRRHARRSIRQVRSRLAHGDAGGQVR